MKTGQTNNTTISLTYKHVQEQQTKYLEEKFEQLNACLRELNVQVRE